MKVLVLDNEESRHKVFAKLLSNHEVIHVYTHRQAAKELNKSKFDQVYLDYDLNDHDNAYLLDLLDRNSSGKDTANYIAYDLPFDKRPNLVIIHSLNFDGALEMKRILVSVGLKVEIKPFSYNWK